MFKDGPHLWRVWQVLALVQNALLYRIRIRTTWSRPVETDLPVAVVGQYNCLALRHALTCMVRLSADWETTGSINRHVHEHADLHMHVNACLHVRTLPTAADSVPGPVHVALARALAARQDDDAVEQQKDEGLGGGGGGSDSLASMLAEFVSPALLQTCLPFGGLMERGH